MTTILDTSFLLATVNSKDNNHRPVIDVVSNLKEKLVLQMTVLTEISYLIVSRLGHHKMRHFLAELVKTNVIIEGIGNSRSLSEVSAEISGIC